jgi:hypothetical protein
MKDSNPKKAPQQEPATIVLGYQICKENTMIEQLTSLCGVGGDCGEPSFTTPKGYPICECGRSTRNKNALVCRDCRDGFILSASDRKVLKAMGIKK